MSPRPDVSEERKRQILEAAMNVFSRLGFHKARMDDIVEESGLSKGTLYWYFKSKDDIIIAILESMFERELVDLQGMLGSREPASERLVKFVDYTIGDIERMLRIMPLAYEFYALAFRQENVREALKHYFHKYLSVLEPIIQEGMDSGEFRPIDTRAVSLALGAIIEGTVLLWVYDPDTVDLHHHGTTSVKFLLEGLQTRE